MSNPQSTLPSKKIDLVAANVALPLFQSTQSNQYLVDHKNFDVITTKRHQMNTYQPSNQVNAFNSIPISFQMDSQYGKPHRMSLDFVVTETSGTNPITLPPVSWMMQQLGSGVDASNTVIQPIQPLSHYIATIIPLTNEELQSKNYKNLLNINNGDAITPTVIPPGGSAQYSIPMDACLMKKIDVQSVAGKINFQAWMNPSPIVTGAGTAAISNMVLRVWTEKNDMTDSKLLDVYARAVVNKGFPQYFEFNFPAQQFSANTPAQLQLSSTPFLNASSMYVVFRSATTGAAAYTFIDISGSSPQNGTIDFQISGGSTSLLGAPIPVQQLRSAMNDLGGLSSTLTTKQPIYGIHFGDGADTFAKDASLSRGYYQFLGNEVIQVTPGTGFATQTLICTIVVTYRGIISQKGGVIKQLA